MKLNISRKTFIIFFGLMIVLMFVSFYIEKKYSPSYAPPHIDMDYAKTNIMMAKKSIEEAKGRINFSGKRPQSAEVFDTESIKLIKEKGFKEISEKPQDPLTKLAELARTKNRTFVNLKEEDLNKKISPNSTSIDNFKVVEYNVLSSSSNISPIYAPSDYIVFKTSSSWKAFTETHKIREAVDVDFSKDNVVVIISKSDLPPGIFKITGVFTEGDTAYIEYRVDALEMAEDNPDAKTNFYSAVRVSKKFKNIKLRQR